MTCFRRVNTIITVMLIAFLMIPHNLAYAAGSTISNIPIGDNTCGVTQNKTATLVMDDAGFTISNTKGDFFIGVEDKTNFGEEKNLYMDEGYELVIGYHPFLVCINTGTLPENSTYTGILTVPIPDGYDAASAYRVVTWDMQTEPGSEDLTKVPVTDNSDGTISFPVKVRYWETAIEGGSSLGEFNGHNYVEFKKTSNNGDTSDNNNNNAAENKSNEDASDNNNNAAENKNNENTPDNNNSAAENKELKEGDSEKSADGNTYTVVSADEAEVALTELPADINGKVTIPETVEINGKTYKVTEIGSEALKNNKKVTSINVGKNIRIINKNAFAGCSKLTNINLGNVEEIGEGALSKCTKLKKLTIPASTKKIGKNALNGDKNLKTLTISGKNINSIGKNAIKNINKNATIKLKGTKKQKNALEKKITKKSTGYKKTMKVKK